MRWRDWIRRAGAAQVRVDGEAVIQVGTNGRRFADAEKAVLASSDGAPGKVEALNADGHILQVWTNDEEEDEPEEVSPAPAETRAGPSRMEEFEAMARILVDACDRSVLRYSEVFKASQDANNSTVKLVTDRLAGVEKAFHRLVQIRAKEVEARGEGVAEKEESGMLDDLMGKVIETAVEKQVDAMMNPPVVVKKTTNGAAKTNGKAEA